MELWHSHAERGEVMPPRPRAGGIIRRQAFQIALILLLGFLAYANTFSVPFIFDDEEYIVNNPAIRDFGYFVDHARLNGLAVQQDVKNNVIIRPLTYLTFALNYRVHGLAVAGFHLVNLLLHLGNGLLVYWLITLILGTRHFSGGPPLAVAGTSRQPGLFPLFAALLFVVHPVQTQGVTYIVQRFTSLATLCYLVAMTAYLLSVQANSLSVRRVCYGAALVAAAAAMWSKEIAFTLPVMILLSDGLFLSGHWKRRLARTVPLLLTMVIIPLTLLRLAGAGDTKSGNALAGSFNLANFDNISSRDYLVTQFRVIVTYIRLMLVPVRQNLDYDYPLFHSLLTPQVGASFLLLCVLLLAACLLLRRSRTHHDATAPWARMTAFGILWFFIALSVESSVIPISDLIFEHRLYLPSIGFIIAVLSSLEMLRERLGHRHPRLVASAVPLLMAAILGLTVATFLRNSVWRDQVVFWQDVADKSPVKTRPHTHLGNAYLRRGLIDEAIREFRTVLSLNPRAYKAHNSLALVYTRLRLFSEAESEFQAALAIKPDDFQTRCNLGYFYTVIGRPDLAIGEFRTAAALSPRNPAIRLTLARACLDQGLLDEAERELHAALEVHPENPDAHDGLGMVYERLGRGDEARREFETAAARRDRSRGLTGAPALFGSR